MFNCDKLELKFKIITPGKYYGEILSRYYNVNIIGKPQIDRHFKGPLSDHFIREYANLFGLPQRLDRIPMSNFKKHIIKGKIKTVTTGYNQARIHRQLHYSVINELVKVKKL